MLSPLVLMAPAQIITIAALTQTKKAPRHDSAEPFSVSRNVDSELEAHHAAIGPRLARIARNRAGLRSAGEDGEDVPLVK